MGYSAKNLKRIRIVFLTAIMSFECACGKKYKYQPGLTKHGLGLGNSKAPCPVYMDRKNNALPLNVTEKEKKEKSDENVNIDIREAIQQKRDVLIDLVRASIKPLSAQKREFFYLLIEREFIKTNEPIYKIGRTIVVERRFMRYSKGSDILVVLKVPDCESFEQKIKAAFIDKFIQRLNIGEEYFEGEFTSMKEMIYRLDLTGSL